MAVDDSVRALADEKFAVVLEDKSDESASGSFGAFAEIRQLLLQFQFSSDAKFAHGTSLALRRAWKANERTQFHERLVKVGAAVGRILCNDRPHPGPLPQEREKVCACFPCTR